MCSAGYRCTASKKDFVENNLFAWPFDVLLSPFRQDYVAATDHEKESFHDQGLRRLDGDTIIMPSDRRLQEPTQVCSRERLSSAPIHNRPPPPLTKLSGHGCVCAPPGLETLAS